jgi:Cyclin-dependent kinase inhibitor 3 (CDKN3)
MNEAQWRGWIRQNVQAADPLLWVIEKRLGCAPRPLRYHPAFGGQIPLIPSEGASALLEWIASIKHRGVKTIICLATHGEMMRYALVTSPHANLLALYRSSGLEVYSHPILDPAHVAPHNRVGILKQIETLKPIVLSEYRSRAGGMLIHCSGGMDRTAPLAAYIASQTLGEDGPPVPNLQGCKSGNIRPGGSSSAPRIGNRS